MSAKYLLYPSEYSKVSAELKQNLKKCQWSWFEAKYFLFNYFPGWLSMVVSDNRKQ